MRVRAIVACGLQKEIGVNGTMPWNLPDDLKHFKRVTKNSTVIMGRKTYESIGFPLPKRQNIVVTRDKNYNAPGCLVVNSVEEATHHVEMENVWILGGEQIYKQMIDYCEEIYMTKVFSNFPDADAYFDIDMSHWKKKEDILTINSKDFPSNEYSFCVSVYGRK